MIFALAMVLSFVEHSLPAMPFLPPGVKLGLSNVVTMYCLFSVGKSAAFTVAGLKSLFILLIRGPISGFLSLCGGMASVLIMLILISFKKQDPSYMLISVAGAVCHNLGQLLGTTAVLKTQFTLYYMPVMVISGVGMGILTGILLRTIMPAIRKMQEKLRY